MSNLTACLLTPDEYAVLRLLREARGLGYHQIEREVYQYLFEEFYPEEPEVVNLDPVPEVEVIDLTGDDDMPDVSGLVGKSSCCLLNLC